MNDKEKELLKEFVGWLKEQEKHHEELYEELYEQTKDNMYWGQIIEAASIQKYLDEDLENFIKERKL